MAPSILTALVVPLLLAVLADSSKLSCQYGCQVNNGAICLPPLDGYVGTGYVNPDIGCFEYYCVNNPQTGFGTLQKKGCALTRHDGTSGWKLVKGDAKAAYPGCCPKYVKQA